MNNTNMGLISIMWLVVIAFLYVIAKTLLDIKNIIEKEKKKQDIKKIENGITTGIKLFETITNLFTKPSTKTKKKRRTRKTKKRK